MNKAEKIREKLELQYLIQTKFNGKGLPEYQEVKDYVRELLNKSQYEFDLDELTREAYKIADITDEIITEPVELTLKDIPYSVIKGVRIYHNRDGSYFVARKDKRSVLERIRDGIQSVLIGEIIDEFFNDDYSLEIHANGDLIERYDKNVILELHHDDKDKYYIFTRTNPVLIIVVSNKELPYLPMKQLSYADKSSSISDIFYYEPYDYLE